MTTIEVDNFTEKAKALIAYLKESFSQEELMELAKEFNEPETMIPDVFEPDDETAISSTNISFDSDSEKQEDSSQYIKTEPIETVFVNDTATIPFEDSPKFRIYWRAWKDGNSTQGQTESNLDTVQAARAEAMTKLYDLGFTDLEILAIETIKSEESIKSEI